MKGSFRIYFAGQDVPPEIQEVSYVRHRIQFGPPVTLAWRWKGQWRIWAPLVFRRWFIITLRRSDKGLMFTVNGGPTTTYCCYCMILTRKNSYVVDVKYTNYFDKL